jgi:hypothetical protein
MIVLLVLVLALTVAECGTVCRTVPGKATGCLETPDEDEDIALEVFCEKKPNQKNQKLR